MKTARIAIIGLGNIAKTHIIALKAIPVLKKTPVLPVLDSLVTRNPASNRDQAAAIGFRQTVGTLSEAFEGGKPDIVDVCTPNSLHLDAVAYSASQGSAVYCEKPLTESYTNSKKLVLSAEGAPLTQTALTYRYHPAVIRIREALRLGLLGDVLQCRISYRRSGYLDASRPVSWRLQDAFSGGGAISDLGVHVLDLFRHFFGELASVSGQTNIFVKKRPETQGGEPVANIRVDDWALMNVRMESGVWGVAEVSRIALGAEAFEVNITGTKGGLTVDLEKEYVPRLTLLDGSSPAIPAPPALDLLPGEKGTMGMAVDVHFGALNHFLHRLAGEDRWPGLAPALADCLKAEEWIDRVLQENQ
ncbi:Gfo/Idh/MocA family protein [Gorillibacterium massiliense]|uniref:Gfo/Idh/MocA family protein n=1 Tax=Gorillibacterium massiliense TaxID=1280390 RepID=UPI0004B76D93|nr:Gfo/Idh/MocA family oxidoreductase [Gorillibacterium massiliense]